MNYKIKITAENQAIVKRIANENGMNPYNFKFHPEHYLYEIQNNQFVYFGTIQKGEEETILTTEQFIEMFDKKEKLSYTESAKKEERITNAEIIKSMNNPTEWQPKRGDRVLVWDDEKTPVERIFLTKIEGKINPIVVVDLYCEEKFLNNKNFNCSHYKHMKPLPIEQPIETDFKTKVIELIEKRIAICIESIEEYKKLNSFSACGVWRNCKHENQFLLKQIKQL